MSDTTTSFTPGLKSKLICDDAVVTLWLRDYTTPDKFTVIDTITWDAKTSEHDEVKAFIYDYGVKQVIGDAPSAMDKTIVKTATNRHEFRKAKLEALKEGIVKTKTVKAPTVIVSDFEQALIDAGQTPEQAKAIVEAAKGKAEERKLAKTQTKK